MDIYGCANTQDIIKISSTHILSYILDIVFKANKEQN